MVRFTLLFAADRDDAVEAYNTLLNDIRDRLAVGERIEGVPSLAPQVPSGGKLEFFDVNLSYTDRGRTSTVQCRLRTDNLYLVGYRPQGSNIWYELGHADGQGRTLINEPNTRTETLDCGENYNTLSSAAQIRLSDTPLGASHIGEAIWRLADRNTNPRLRARAILTVVFTVAEGARFRSISTHISDTWWDESPTPGEQFANQVRNWARLSSAVQRTRNEGHNFRDDFDDCESTGIWDFVSAIAVLGIMHLVKSASKPKGSISDTSVAVPSRYAQGQPLLEIFSVRVNPTDGESPGDLCGTITVTDGARTHRIWERTESDNGEFGGGEHILLEGPSKPISAADDLYIDLDLWDRETASPEDPIAKDTISFNPLDYFTEYDVVQNRHVTGKDGSATVSYVAITDGLYADIAVVLVDVDGDDSDNVYGEIVARNGHGRSELFRKERGKSLRVKPRDSIPLSRTIVAVPTRNTLVIQANLWDYEAMSPDDEIVSGSVEFEPKYKESEKKIIIGAYGTVEVRVSWM